MSAGADRAAAPLGRGLVRTWLAALAGFAILAGAAGWWQVVEAERLATDPDNPAIAAAARRTLRGTIVDREGRWLARSLRDARGEAYRVYRDPAIAHVVGYASRRFGTSGLERVYAAELLGFAGVDDLAGLGRKLGARPEPQGLELTLDLALQRAAVDLLGDDRGAVVLLDPATGELLALASTPGFDPSAVADPAGGADAFAALRADPTRPLLPRATLGRYVPGSVLKIVTAIAGLRTGGVAASTTFPEQPAAEVDGLPVDGFRIRDGHHPETGATPVDLARAVEVSCNLWFALAGLRIGGTALVATAADLGFGAPIPFELPTEPSLLTGGDGAAPGGFADDVELAAASFGQGEAFVTPLQMALVAAVVANDGLLVRPRVVAAVTGSGPAARRTAPEALRRVLAVGDARTIRDAMVRAVEGELGRRFTTGAAIPGITVAGKSGTAQLDGPGRSHSWFIGFVPGGLGARGVAIAVVVERGGRGGERAAPLAGRLLARFVELRAGR